MRLRTRLWLIAITLIAAPAGALAQDGGAGVRVGDLELHPSLSILGGYDSNPFFRDELDFVNNSEGVVSSGLLRMTPALQISTLSMQRRRDGDSEVALPFVDFRAGLSAGWYYLMNPDSQVGVFDQVEVNGNLAQTFNPERPFSLHLEQKYSRRRIPLLDGSAFQNHVEAGIRPELSTPGGLLRGSIRYNFGYDFFDDNGNNFLRHEFGQELHWEFLPKTALFQDLAVSIQNFTNANVSEGADSEPLSDRNDSIRVTARGGMNGALTKTIAMTLSAGITNGFIDQNPDAKDLVAQAQFRWRPSQTFGMTLTGRRSGENSLQGNTLTRTGVDLEATVNIGSKVTVTGKGEVELGEFGDDVRQLETKAAPAGFTLIRASQSSLLTAAQDTAPRQDLKVNLGVDVEYRMLRWLALSGEAAFFMNNSDYVFITPVADDMSSFIANPAAFQGFRVLAGLRAFL